MYLLEKFAQKKNWYFWKELLGWFFPTKTFESSLCILLHLKTSSKEKLLYFTAIKLIQREKVFGKYVSLQTPQLPQRPEIRLAHICMRTRMISRAGTKKNGNANNIPKPIEIQIAQNKWQKWFSTEKKLIIKIHTEKCMKIPNFRARLAG